MGAPLMSPVNDRTWFTADTHFSHANIIKYCNRPFPDVQQMNETLIANWNAVVGARDQVWHLGDFAFRDAAAIHRRLNGRIHIVWGNHDKATKQIADLFASSQDIAELETDRGELIVLHHYAQRVWHQSHRGSWHLYGHSHGGLPNFHRSMDVGVDCHNYAPICLPAIRDYMLKQDVTLHHPEMVARPWKPAGAPPEDE